MDQIFPKKSKIFIFLFIFYGCYRNIFSKKHISAYFMSYLKYKFQKLPKNGTGLIFFLIIVHLS